MFSTIVVSLIFAVTTVMVPFLAIQIFGLPSHRIDWFKVSIFFAIWFFSGTYLFG